MRSLIVGRRGVVLSAALCLLWALPVSATGVETKLAIPLFLKIVSYDERFVAQKKLDTLRMYFLYDFADAKSYQQYQDAKEYFSTVGELTVSGVPVKLLGIQRPDADSIIILAPDSLYSIVVCAAGQGPKFQEMSSKLRLKNCHSFALDCGDLAAGVAVSVEAKKHKTAIVVNLRSARAEGSRFSARLLSMCTIVDRPS